MFPVSVLNIFKIIDVILRTRGRERTYKKNYPNKILQNLIHTSIYSYHQRNLKSACTKKYILNKIILMVIGTYINIENF